MGKMCILVVFSLLLIAGYSIVPGNVSVVDGDNYFATEFTYWRMDMDIAEGSLASFTGEVINDMSGDLVSNAGDVNGDGYDDFLIGTYRNDEGGTDAGQTYLILGKSTGWSRGKSLANADASFIGEVKEDTSGWSASCAGDVNGDGYDDILIGAWQNDEGGAAAGQTYLILGKSAGWSMDTSLSSVDASFIGEVKEDRSGISVSGAGDVNGDGYDDILVGAWTSSAGGYTGGQTYLILGKATGWSMDTSLSNANASFLGGREDACGWSVSGAGDVNGDGFDDILIGAYYNSDGASHAGQTYLFFGKATGWLMDTSLSNADASFIGEAVDDWSGCCVSKAGDVNGDGFDDILIGSRKNSGSFAGKIYLILGKSTGWSMRTSLSTVDASFIAENTGDYTGESLSSAGDINGDGYDDIVIGAPRNGEGGVDAGQTYLIFGKSTGWSMNTILSNADASFIGEFAYDYSGWCVSGAGDVNGDGLDDILIGAYANDDGGSLTGQTYLIPGGDGYLKFKTDLTPTTATTGDELTFSVEMDGKDIIPTMFVEYWFGEGEHFNATMTGIGNLTWNHTIMVPANSLDLLNYNFSASIMSRFWINTSVKNITILDNDKPEFGNELTPSSAFTGDPFIFSIMTTDNIGVKKVDVEYWFGSGAHEKISLTRKPTSLWEAEITIPLNSLDDLNYKYIACDDSENYNETTIKNISLNDNDIPWFKQSPWSTSTVGGADLPLSTVVMDNIAVSSVSVEYWYSQGSTADNVSLEKGDADEWHADVTIANIEDTFHYRFHAVDTSGNWNQTMIFDVDVKVQDNDPPVFGEDTSDTSATTGGSFTFRVSISDNIGLERSYVKFWYDPDESQAQILSGNGTYTTTITVPMNWTELSYSFHALDAAENHQETEPRTIEVLDNYAPMILEHIPEDTCETGCVLPLSVKASDNIAVSNVSVKYWYGDGDHRELVLEDDGDQFSSSLEVPVDSVETLYYLIRVVDAAGNQNETPVYEVEIIDSIAPTLGTIDDIEIYVGDEIDITLNADDNIGIVSYFWTGSPIDVSGNRLSGVLEEVGEYIIQVRVKDGEGNSNSTTFTLTVLPLDHDEDGDGIPDLVEIEFGLDPNDGSDAALDLDGDGLSNLREYELGTDMDNDDSDGDGFSDGYEVANGFDPLDPQSRKDIEGPEDEGSNSWIWIAIVIVVIVLLIVVAIIVFLFMRKKKEEPEEAVSDDSAKETVLTGEAQADNISPPAGSIDEPHTIDQGEVPPGSEAPQENDEDKKVTIGQELSGPPEV